MRARPKIMLNVHQNDSPDIIPWLSGHDVPWTINPADGMLMVGGETYSHADAAPAKPMIPVPHDHWVVVYLGGSVGVITDEHMRASYDLFEDRS